MIKNEFWRDALKTYLDFKTPIKLEDVNINVFQTQLLFNNNLVKFRNKVLYFARWKEQGLERLKDTICFNTNRLFTLNEIQNN